jgi:hypothetical protein
MIFILDGIEANPENFLDVNYEFDLRDRKRMKLSPVTNVVTFFGEDKQRILDFVNQYSRAQGMPCSINFEDANNTIIEMYLDFTTSSFEIGDDFVNCEMVRRGATQAFINRADGRLLSVVSYLNSDIKEIDYQVIQPQQALYFISLQLALLSLQQEIGRAIQAVQEGIADVQEASIPIVVVGVGAGAGPNTGAIVAASIKLAARVAYAIFIFAALINIITDILKIIFPPVRQFKCMNIRTMLQRAVSELGFQLQSTLLDELPELRIIPVPMRKKEPSWFEEVFQQGSLAFNEAYPTGRDTIQTIGNLIDFIEDTFNAETVVSNGVVRIENRLWFEQVAVGNLIENFNIMPDETTTISYADTLHKRKLISYAIDSSDINTLDDQEGTIDEYNVSLINSPFPDIVTLKGLESITIDECRATPKNKLNAMELTAKALASAVDFFTGGNLSQLVEDRKYIMRISDQYFTVTKVAYCQGSRLHPNQNTFIGTELIEQKYWADRRPENNQIKITVGMPIGLGLDKILALEQNNYVILGNRVIRINYVNFNDDDNDAVIDFEEREQMPNIQTVRL